MFRALAFIVGIALVAGCLGSDKTFPDESDQVRTLHVNAYQKDEGAIVEVSGLGDDHQERAFRGHVRVVLEKALHPEANVQYERVKEYDADVTARDFSSATVAYWKLTIPPPDLATDTSYRVVATATIAGRSFEGSALFDHA